MPSSGCIRNVRKKQKNYKKLTAVTLICLVYTLKITICLSLFPAPSFQGHSMPATKGPLSPLTPRRSGQKDTPICTSSIHQSPCRLQPAPESPSALLMASLGPTVAFRARLALLLVSARSSRGKPPLLLHG